ncbi:MAG: ABC transporter ATP-binding protein, partial [Chloroflexi bacterium]|nr:ABC transporter ATP-binding protein [Chloroflexota bacterium]
GLDLREDAALIRRQIGVVSHRPYLYDELTARENLKFYGKMYGLANLEARIEEVADYVGLRRRLNDRVRTFSRGMQQRLAIARAVLHEPAILLLDEPETGLDQWAASRLPELLGALGPRRRTIFMTTHSLEMGLRVADRVAILDRGRVIFEGASAGLDVDALRDVYYQATSGSGGRS